MKYLLALIALIFFPLISFADCCICETDTRIQSEIKFYNMGCGIWHGRQKGCTTKVTRPIGAYGSELSIPAACQGKTVKLGYVGHWSSAAQSQQYIQSTLLPAMVRHGISLEFDNTACRGHDNTDALQKYVTDHVRPKLRANQYLRLLGNQVNSVGLWDGILGSSHNLGSAIDSRKAEAAYPKCSTFENQQCLEKSAFLPLSQVGERGWCRDGREHYQLVCQSAPYIGDNERMMGLTVNMWKRTDSASKETLERTAAARAKKEREANAKIEANLKKAGFHGLYSRDAGQIDISADDHFYRDRETCAAAGEGTQFRKGRCFASATDSLSLTPRSATEFDVVLLRNNAEASSGTATSHYGSGRYTRPGELVFKFDDENCSAVLETQVGSSDGAASLRFSGDGCKNIFSDVKKGTVQSGFFPKAEEPVRAESSGGFWSRFAQ